MISLTMMMGRPTEGCGRLSAWQLSNSEAKKSGPWKGLGSCDEGSTIWHRSHKIRPKDEESRQHNREQRKALTGFEIFVTTSLYPR
jgi:hypothetical protein